jgi:hypothetical protein
MQKHDMHRLTGVPNARPGVVIPNRRCREHPTVHNNVTPIDERLQQRTALMAAVLRSWQPQSDMHSYEPRITQQAAVLCCPCRVYCGYKLRIQAATLAATPTQPRAAAANNESACTMLSKHAWLLRASCTPPGWTRCTAHAQVRHWLKRFNLLQLSRLRHQEALSAGIAVGSRRLRYCRPPRMTLAAPAASYLPTGKPVHCVRPVPAAVPLVSRPHLCPNQGCSAS